TPSIKTLTFVPDSAGSRSGVIKFEVENFEGNLDLQIDYGKGDYAPATTITKGLAVLNNRPQEIRFDGKDKSGKMIPITKKLNLRLNISNFAEIHFIDRDVEVSEGGVKIKRLNGPLEDRNLVFWDDSYLNEPQADLQYKFQQSTTNPLSSGVNGVDSSNGVHSWGLGNANGTQSSPNYYNPTPSNTSNGGTWGNNRIIDNWTSIKSQTTSGTIVNDTTPLMSLGKQANLNDLNANNLGDVGEVVTYTFTITNPGTTTIHNVVVNDPMPGLGSITYTWPGVAGVLNPGQQATGVATYTIKQADVDTGKLENTAIATGKLPDETDLPDPPTDKEVVPIEEHDPALTIDKIATIGDLNGNKLGDLNEIVTYTFDVTNTGNVTLHDVVVSDPMPNLSTITYTWPGVAGVLAPGQKVLGRATYTITQTDIDNSLLENTATATGKLPDEKPLPNPPQDKEVVPLAINEALLTIDKQAAIGDLNGNSLGDVNEIVTYTFIVTNTGNTTLNNVVVSDPMPNLSTITYAWPGVAGILAPGQQVRASATYKITQADIDNGQLENTATANGKLPDGTNLPNPPQDKEVVPLATNNPALTLDKQAVITDLNANNLGDVDEIVTYTFIIKNTGNVTLNTVVVSDPMPNLSTITYTWPAADGVLAPGEQATGVATYKITQADVDNVVLTNTATATAKLPNKSNLLDPPTDSELVPLTLQNPALTLDKVASLDDLNGNKLGDVNEIVTYTFTFKNTGTITLHDVIVSDPMPGLAKVSYTWPGADGILAPGQQATGVATYKILQDNVDSGKLENVATATAKLPDGKDLPDPPTDKEIVP
ncbi:MAG: DUF7507 domain-containing protein, partial [Bacilli bacterium]